MKVIQVFEGRDVLVTAEVKNEFIEEKIVSLVDNDPGLDMQIFEVVSGPTALRTLEEDAPQRQDSLDAQLRTVRDLANRHGCYDAADFIRDILERGHHAA